MDVRALMMQKGMDVSELDNAFKQEADLKTPKGQYLAAWKQAPDLKTKNAIADAWQNASGTDLLAPETDNEVDLFTQAGVQPKEIPTDEVQRAVMIQQLKSGTLATPRKEAEDKLSAAAEGLKSTIEDYKAGKISKEQYSMDKANYASQLAAAKGFAEGGKVLSKDELAILSGQIPIMKKRVPTAVEHVSSWFTGELPNVTSVVQDSDAELLNKANMVLQKKYVKEDTKQKSTGRFTIVKVE